MSRTVDEIQADIDIYTEAIRNVALVGQSYMLVSGGSTRQFTAASLPELRKTKAALENELADASGTSGGLVGF